MKPSHLIKTVLIIAGLVGLLVGLATVFVPTQLHATSGITMDSSPSLLSETRAPGGAILLISVLMVLGAFQGRLTFSALLVSTLVYLGYGLARLFSIVIDGLPNSELVVVCAFEITVGLVCLAALERYLKAGQALRENPEGMIS